MFSARDLIPSRREKHLPPVGMCHWHIDHYSFQESEFNWLWPSSAHSALLQIFILICGGREVVEMGKMGICGSCLSQNVLAFSCWWRWPFSFLLPLFHFVAFIATIVSWQMWDWRKVADLFFQVPLSPTVANSLQ